MSRTFFTTAAALLAIGSAIASEIEVPSARDVIEARQSGLKRMGAAMKSIAEQLKTDAPDFAKMALATQVIGAGAKEQPNWFPPGSGPESGVETDALPYIWKDTAKFTALSGQLGVESGNLTAAVASKDVATIRNQFKVLADVCSSCHKSFRED